MDEDFMQGQESPEPMEPEDEDEMFLQEAPNDIMVALQLLRSQFPAKARVGSCPSAPDAVCRVWHNACIAFAAVQEVIQPFMLRSQLYSLVEDRTMVDRELDELRYALSPKPTCLQQTGCMSVMVNTGARRRACKCSSWLNLGDLLCKSVLRASTCCRRNHDVRMLKLPTAPDDYAFMMAEDYAAAIQQQHTTYVQVSWQFAPMLPVMQLQHICTLIIPHTIMYSTFLHYVHTACTSLSGVPPCCCTYLAAESSAQL